MLCHSPLCFIVVLYKNRGIINIFRITASALPDDFETLAPSFLNLKKSHMKKNFLLALFATFFMVWSCSDTKDKKSKEDNTEDTGKKKTTDDESANEESSNVQSGPIDVVRAIFKAAKSGDYSEVSGICADDADKDAKMICEIESQSEETQQKFKDEFSKGKVTGDAEINGNEASVKIMFGPDGDKEETMMLTKKGKKWYLSSF